MAECGDSWTEDSLRELRERAERQKDFEKVLEYMDSYKLDPYRVLGVSKRETDRKIHAAYLKLGLKYHPDKQHKDHFEVCNKIMVLVNAARDTLLGGSGQVPGACESAGESQQMPAPGESSNTGESYEQSYYDGDEELVKLLQCVRDYFGARFGPEKFQNGRFILPEEVQFQLTNAEHHAWTDRNIARDKFGLLRRRAKQDKRTVEEQIAHEAKTKRDRDLEKEIQKTRQSKIQKYKDQLFVQDQTSKCIFDDKSVEKFNKGMIELDPTNDHPASTKRGKFLLVSVRDCLALGGNSNNPAPCVLPNLPGPSRASRPGPGPGPRPSRASYPGPSHVSHPEPPCISYEPWREQDKKDDSSQFESETGSSDQDYCSESSSDSSSESADETGGESSPNDLSAGLADQAPSPAEEAGGLEDYGSHDPNKLQVLESMDSKEKAKVQGVFTYKFGDSNTDFAGSNQTREFVNLKTTISRHLETDKHLENLAEAQEVEALAKKNEHRNHKIGMTVARNVYTGIKLGHSQNQFEMMMAVDAAKGLDVGSMNHSRMFAADLTKSIHKALKDRMTDVLNEPIPATGKPTPVAIIADKLTPNRSTQQIIGMVGYVNGEVQSLFAYMGQVKDRTGEGVATSVMEGISSLELSGDVKSRYVGAAFDGEYFNLNEPAHLNRMLAIPEDNEKFYSYQWDPAHVIELAAKDAKSMEVERTEKTIASVNSSIKYGKGFSALLNEAASADQKSRTPGSFSDTRFATYSGQVYENFIQNYPFVYNIMNNDAKDELDDINNATFTSTVAGLADIYKEIGQTSRGVQKVDILPWEVREKFKTHQNTLDKMKTEFKQNSPSPLLESADKDKKKRIDPLYNTKVAHTELMQSSEFRGKPVFTKRHTVHQTRAGRTDESQQTESFEAAYKASTGKLVGFIEKYEKRLNERLDESRPEILNTVSAIFNINEIKDRQGELPGELSDLVEMSRKAGRIENSVTNESIEHQYSKFSERMVTLYDNMKTKDPKTTQSSAYNNAFRDPDFYKDIPEVMDMALSSMVRTHCEAVVEGMGSIVTSHSSKHHRERLSQNQLAMEAYIHWNGPNPARASDELLKRAQDIHFGGRSKWHYLTDTDRPDKIKFHKVSKVVDRINESKSKIPF